MRESLCEFVSTNFGRPCCLLLTAPNSASAHLERDYCFKRPVLVSLRLIILRFDSEFGYFQKGNHATNEWRRRRRKLLGLHIQCPRTYSFIAPFSHKVCAISTSRLLAGLEVDALVHLHASTAREVPTAGPILGLVTA
jgi:hypothetical protein